MAGEVVLGLMRGKDRKRTGKKIHVSPRVRGKKWRWPND